MTYMCPVCGFFGLAEPPYRNGQPSYEICPCCGFEFGFDDGSEGYTFSSYRKDWIERGMPWFKPAARPNNWNPEEQLERVRHED